MSRKSRFFTHSVVACLVCVLFCSRVKFSERIRIMIRFNVWLVSGYTHVLVLLSVVIVHYPCLCQVLLLLLLLLLGIGKLDILMLERQPCGSKGSSVTHCTADYGPGQTALACMPQ